MKPWIAFLGGAVVAGGVALIGLRPSPEPAPEPVPIVAQQVTPVEPIGAEPLAAEPVAVQPAKPAPVASPAPVRNPSRATAKPNASTSTRTPPQLPVVSASEAPPTAARSPDPTAPAHSQPAPAAPPSSPQSATVREPEAPVAPPPPPAPPNQVTIPAGSKVTVRLGQALSTERAQVGDSFVATLDQPLVSEGFVLAERGARVTGKITASDPGGKVKGVSLLGLELTSFRTSDGQTVEIKTVEFRKEAESNTKNDAAKVAVGAGVGAALGAIFGGGKGAAIGAGSGAAAGTGVVLATRGKAANLPAETRLTFQIQAPVTVTEKR
ncbi:MAG: hypothetical protein JNK87_32055 [Bryobacterales bacterium]|nr:hypothetical protein [Bryobacterales bacterium]